MNTRLQNGMAGAFLLIQLFSLMAAAAPAPPSSHRQHETLPGDSRNQNAGPSVPGEEGTPRFLVPEAPTPEQSRRLRSQLTSRDEHELFSDTQLAFAGTGAKWPQLSSPDSAYTLLATGYAWAIAPSRFLQLSAQLVPQTRSTGRLDFSYLFMFSRARYRPILHLGPSLRVQPDDGLANFIRYQSWGVRGAAGTDMTLSTDFSLRLTVDIAGGVDWLEGSMSLLLLISWRAGS